MDQAFLEYYEEELTHIRAIAQEFAALHPNVARNLSLDTVPCPDPYVERLLEGVAFLAARTRLKIDAESSRYVRNLIDTIYPDLAGPSPAMGLVALQPGPQVQRMLDGHVMKRGTHLVSGLREGQQTRCTYTACQAVHFWPIRIAEVSYLQDKGALSQAGISEADARRAGSGLRIRIARDGPGALSELSLDGLDLFFGAGERGGPLFDAIFGRGVGAVARPADGTSRFAETAVPSMLGVDDGDTLLPRVRTSFEGYRLLREYFLMPERFYFVRLSGLSPVVRRSKDTAAEVVLLFSDERPELMGVSTKDFALHVTPIVNLFEHACNMVEIRPNRSAHIVHADRTRPKDYEIYRLLRVEDADADGPQARITPLFSVEAQNDSGHVYTAERRPRRPDTEEIRRGQTRSAYTGDDFYLSIGRPAGSRATRTIRRVDVRALCTNRDLPIQDDMPTLTLDSGDPVQAVRMLGPLRRPRPSLRAMLPQGATDDARVDDLTWRWISQLNLNHISLAEDARGAEPLRALLKLYSDRGDPALARHGDAIVRVRSERLVERLQIDGPLCFGHGTQIRIDINESLLSGGSNLLLTALLARLFARHTAINSFVRTKAHLTQSQMEVTWPMKTGTRALI